MIRTGGRMVLRRLTVYWTVDESLFSYKYRSPAASLVLTSDSQRLGIHSSPMASLVLTDSSQLTSDSQHLGIYSSLMASLVLTDSSQLTSDSQHLEQFGTFSAIRQSSDIIDGTSIHRSPPPSPLLLLCKSWFQLPPFEYKKEKLLNDKRATFFEPDRQSSVFLMACRRPAAALVDFRSKFELTSIRSLWCAGIRRSYWQPRLTIVVKSPRSQLLVKVVRCDKKELLATSTNQRCEACLKRENGNAVSQ
uniref:(California timema) hypothetical protein n=1 Tax=Timema californicum TaxID=61474 RepID=A0A7R9JCC2_TIMCA|nr:unnamed protein product [Timema californicum]